MAGHSKWANIQHRKKRQDAKRGKIFTKLIRVITVAAREGGSDLSANPKLRDAIEKAKAANMTNDTIDRAVKKGAGELGGAQMVTALYEGYGPSGVAVMVECLTDNKNRTAQAIKHILTKFNGSLGSPNSVMWQFEQKGVIRIANEKLSEQNLDELELQIIDLGAQDLIKEADSWVIYNKIEDLQKVNKGIEDLGIDVEYAEIEYIAKEQTSVDQTIKEKNQKLFEALDDEEDVDDYYTNLKE